MKKFKQTFIILLLISIGNLATDIYLPSLPAIAVSFQVDPSLVQLSIFSYMLSFSFTPLFFGPLSDHIGRMSVVRLGVAISLAATVGCIFSNTIYIFIACRFIQGVGAGAVLIAGRSMISDIFKGKEMATQISYITMSIPLVLAFAPVIGGYLQEAFQWQAAFLFLAFYISAIFLVTLNVEESLQAAGRRHISQMMEGYRQIVSKPLFLLFGAGVMLPAVGTLAYLTSSPFLFQEIIGLTPAQYGLLALGIGASIMGASYINVRLLRIFPINQILWLGNLCMIGSGLVLLFGHFMGILNAWTLLLSAMLYFCCFPFIGSNSVSKALSQTKHHLGGANAVITSGQFLMGTLGTLIFSLIPVKNGLPLAVCFLTLGLISALVLSAAIRYEKKNQEVVL